MFLFLIVDIPFEENVWVEQALVDVLQGALSVIGQVSFSKTSFVTPEKSHWFSIFSLVSRITSMEECQVDLVQLNCLVL